MITTVLLSYNRLHLLKITIESYLATISVPYELFIVDNASSKDVRDYILEVSKNNDNIKPIFLDENIGGEGFNVGFDKGIYPFFHASENDLEYLDGWDKEMLSKFEIFPELGQLSLISHMQQKQDG